MNKIIQPVSQITLAAIGKKFNNRWIFNNIDFQISPSDRIAILGNNGSGKSTLLQILAGYVSPSSGYIIWKSDSKEIPVENVYKHVSLASPYLELIEEFTLRENINFFRKMKPLQDNCDASQLIAIAELEEAADRSIKYFSSGMKQRVKLALAFLAETSLLLLDEPLSNLDSKGYEWYQKMSEKYVAQRILIVCSNNVASETMLCSRKIDMELFKKNKLPKV